MHVHILGICGTFMGSLALLARELGYTVSGSDQNVYPPMSTQLEQQGIELINGYENDQLSPRPDVVIVGNVMTRGKPVVELLLNSGIRYTSGPQWLADHVLHDRWVVAVAGTHGKTTTSSMLAWVLASAKLDPGYLIGGVPNNFECSSRLGSEPFFVIEADEYDSAFFDKRSKFVHYRPRTAILNNLEFDHADIFSDLAAIQTQFHHLVRTVPENGLIVAPAQDVALSDTLARGCWTETQRFDVLSALDAVPPSEGWWAKLLKADGTEFDCYLDGKKLGEVRWPLTGRHSVHNGLAALIAARHVGVTVDIAASALCEFQSVKRRMEVLYRSERVTIYDDFAHHPTAIATTLDGLRQQLTASLLESPSGRILAIIEPRSNTMKAGVHKDRLLSSIKDADATFWYAPDAVDWDMTGALTDSAKRSTVFDSLDTIVAKAVEWTQPGDHVVVMSNGGFGGLHQKLVKAFTG